MQTIYDNKQAHKKRSWMYKLFDEICQKRAITPSKSFKEYKCRWLQMSWWNFQVKKKSDQNDAMIRCHPP